MGNGNYGDIDSIGKVKITKKDEYDDKITCITACIYESKPYIFFINNNEIIVINNECKKDPKDENKNNQKHIISLSISSDLLVYTDGFQLYLKSFPQLIDIYSSPQSVFGKSIFIKENNNTYISCMKESKVKLLVQYKKFTVIAESEHFDFEPKIL